MDHNHFPTAELEREKGGEQEKVGKTIHCQQWKHNTKVAFLCSTCRDMGVCSLVAVGLSSRKEATGANRGISVTHVYFHNAHCQSTTPSISRVWYETSKCSLVPFDFKNIMGDTYEKAIRMLNDFREQKPYFDSSLNEEEREELKGRIPGLDALTDKAAHLEACGSNPCPPGVLINFGENNYDLDDRKCKLLPSQLHKVKRKKHKCAMLRLRFHFCATFGLTQEMAPCILDEFKIQAQMDSQGHVVNKHEHKTNKNWHLRPTEVSLLFGGHEQRVCGIDPVAQPRHRDGDTEEKPHGNTPALENKTFPFSFIVPLEDNREVCIGTPATTVTIPKGCYLIFRGDLPHGGIQCN
jgi:hypothetical protein